MTHALDQAGFLALLRRLERGAPDKPRIGRSARLSDDIVLIGQDPRLDFPASDISGGVPGKSGGPAHLRARFMGLFGPQGALPLNTTEEVLRWTEEGDDAFARFADIFAGRFYQLFFRAWSDSHAITQADRPDEDRFASYVAAVSGIGSPAFARHDALPDLARLPLVSIFGGRVRSAVRLRQMLHLYFGHQVEVEEHVPDWLSFEADDMKGLGRGGGLGRDIYLGSRVRSVSEKIRIHLCLPKRATYEGFLPGRSDYVALSSLVYWYLGKSYAVDLALSLPRKEVPDAGLGQTISLGWMAAIAPDRSPDAPEFVEIAQFALDPDLPQERGAA